MQTVAFKFPKSRRLNCVALVVADPIAKLKAVMVVRNRFVRVYLFLKRAPR